MEIFKNFFFSTFFGCLFLFTILMTACSQESDLVDPQKIVAVESQEVLTSDQNAVSGSNTRSESVQPIVDKIYAQVIESNNQQTKYLLFVEMSNSESLPDELYVKGFALTDDGKYEDELAGDGIYTVYNPITRNRVNQQIGSIKVIYNNNKDDKAQRIEPDPCEIRVVWVGDPCAGGTCPSDSIFGGSSWFCLCVSGCGNPFV